MILMIIKSYLAILLPIFGGAVFILFIGLYFIIRFIYAASSPQKSEDESLNTKSEANIPEEWQSDIAAIAGDDVITTQLDLARAFIEAGKSASAQKILMNIAITGNPLQQNEANNLLKSLST